MRNFEIGMPNNGHSKTTRKIDTAQANSTAGGKEKKRRPEKDSRGENNFSPLVTEETIKKRRRANVPRYLQKDTEGVIVYGLARGD